MLLLSFGASLTVTSEPLASQLGTIEITDDAPTIALTVDTRAAVAFAQRYQRLGVRVDLETTPGSGVMRTLPAHEVGEELTITESTDSYGDILTVKLNGPRFSPFARRILQAKTGIDVYFVIGSPGNEFMAKVFTGFVTEASYEVQPPSATVTALDAAGLYAEKRAKDWSLPPNSERTRLSINLELLTIGEIPIRSIDLGPDGGGIVNKPHTLGDRPILEFLRDFDAVLGVEIGFEAGGFVAKRHDATLPTVLELNPSNLLPQITIDAPKPLDPNVLGVVSTSSTLADLGGYVTESLPTVIVTGPYAPDTAVQKIANGVVTDTLLSPVESVQTISESFTTVTKLGNVAVRTEKLERGWYAERAAGAQVVRVGSSPSSPGVWEYTVDPVPGTVYVFPDGSTRAVPRETLRDLARSVATKTLDDQNRVVAERELRYRWQRFQQAIFKVGLFSSVLADEPPQSGGAIPIWDDGFGAQWPTEIFGLSSVTDQSGETPPTELTEKEFTLNEAGEIIKETTREYSHALPLKSRRQNQAFRFGLESTDYYADDEENRGWNAFNRYQQWRSVVTTEKTYRALDEDSYVTAVSVREGSKAPTVTTSDPIIGSLPRPEKAEPTNSSQEIRATYEDRDRIALAGEEIEDIVHNEFVETQAEAEAYARHRARLASARTLNCSMPIEGLVHKWRPVRVNIPGASIEGLSFYVRQVRRDAASFSQAIVAEHYSDLI